MGVPPITVVAVIIIMRGVVAVIITVSVAAAVVIAPGKGSGENPKKSSPTEKKGTPLGAFNIKRSINGGNRCTP